MKKRVEKKSHIKFLNNIEDSLSSITTTRAELKKHYKEEFKKITLREKEEIALAKQRAKKAKKDLKTRFKSKEKELGKLILDIKKTELEKRLKGEFKELNKTNRHIKKITSEKKRLKTKK